MEKDLAHQIITRAIKSGRLKRPNKCSSCSKSCKPFAHHEDDNRPLDVVWLCYRCHTNKHMDLRREQQADIMLNAVRYAKTLVIA